MILLASGDLFSGYVQIATTEALAIILYTLTVTRNKVNKHMPQHMHSLPLQATHISNHNVNMEVELIVYLHDVTHTELAYLGKWLFYLIVLILFINVDYAVCFWCLFLLPCDSDYSLIIIFN